MDHPVSCNISQTSLHAVEALLSNTVRYPANVEVPNAHNKTHANDRPIAIIVVQVLDMAYRSMPGQGVAPIVLARRAVYSSYYSQHELHISTDPCGSVQSMMKVENGVMHPSSSISFIASFHPMIR